MTNPAEVEKALAYFKKEQEGEHAYYGHVLASAYRSQEAELARLRRELDEPRWRCFHCDETFIDEEAASLHFGPSEVDTPACQVSPERLRELERQLADYREEDTDLHRELLRQRGQHQVDLRREEEKGYARGLADGYKERDQARADAEKAREELAEHRDCCGAAESREASDLTWKDMYEKARAEAAMKAERKER